MKTVIFHSADFDGIFCREIARKFLGEKDVQFIGWNFGDPVLHFPVEGTVYIMDLPLKEVFGLQAWMWGSVLEGWTMALDLKRVIWIDHHKTSIESHPKGIPGYRIDGVAACRLAWQWFSLGAHKLGAMALPGEEGTFVPKICFDCIVTLPPKDIFIDRVVHEPLAVRLVGEYDIWDKRDERADTFQYGLRADDLTAVTWYHLLEGQNPGLANELVGIILKQGKYAQKYAQYLDSESMREAGFILDWEGVKFLCLNSVARGSLRFQSRDVPETGHDALMSFGFNGRLWTVSLYHAKHQTEIDLSKIAKKYGGGGHAGACGFTCKKLPFADLLYNPTEQPVPR